MDAPAVILRQQAARLSERTRNLLQGRVGTWGDGHGGLIHDFNIVVPTLENYEYRLFKIGHPVEGYPVTVYEGEGEGTSLQNKEELIAWLKSVLSSERTKRIIASLGAQVQ